MSTETYAEIVRLQPKPQTRDRLLAIRDDLVAFYRDNYPEFRGCRLLQLEEGDVWVDLWFWATKEAAEDALRHTERNPLFVEWADSVEIVGFEWAHVLSDHVLAAT